MSNLNLSEFDALFGNLSVPSSSTQENVAKPVNENKTNATTNANVEVVNTNNTSNFDTLLHSAQVKMQQISVEMNNEFVERDKLINLMLLAITTGTNLLMLGPPGTGKTMVTQSLCSRIDNANYFQWMLNKTTDPSEVFGTFSIKAMENDKFMRITTGKLPEAHIAFLDECYKSNDPMLNALLTITNEHIFYNDGKPQPVPLISLFGASNEPPEDKYYI